MSDGTNIFATQKDIRRLEIKLEVLVQFLNTSHLGPPDGRVPYDAMVKEALKKEGL